MPTTREALWGRVTSLCIESGFTRAVTPFDFDQQPTGLIDGAIRLTVEGGAPIGGFRMSEERTDTFVLWVARKHGAAPQEAYERLLTDVSSLTAGVVRDGAFGGGDYAVPDGAAVNIEHENGREFAVARLALPVNYEVQL